MTASNYPPGVTGSEPQIAGAPEDDDGNIIDDDDPILNDGDVAVHDERCQLDTDHDGDCTWPEPDPNDEGPRPGDDGDGMLCDGDVVEPLTHRLARENREAVARVEARIDELVHERLDINREVKELRAALVALNAAGRHFAKQTDGGAS